MLVGLWQGENCCLKRRLSTRLTHDWVCVALRGVEVSEERTVWSEKTIQYGRRCLMVVLSKVLRRRLGVMRVPLEKMCSLPLPMMWHQCLIKDPGRESVLMKRQLRLRLSGRQWTLAIFNILLNAWKRGESVLSKLLKLIQPPSAL